MTSLATEYQAAHRSAAFREGQQLRGEECGPRAGDGGLVQHLLHGRVRGQIHLGQLDVALDDREEVIEIVRDAAGQQAEGFEFAGTKEFLFHLFALRSLSPQSSGGLLEFSRALLHTYLQLLIQGVRVVLGRLQIFEKIVVFKLQVQ